EADRVVVIPNAVDVNDLDRPGLPGREFRLGIVGIVPLRKRWDRALQLVEGLRERDERFTLHVRGRMPWEYPHEWRKPYQREAYLDQFARLGQSVLRDAVAFEPFGADMGSWLTKIGWVLSPSSTESFHLAPAEGMVSGAVPLIWDRPGARDIFGDEFVVTSTQAAIDRIHRAATGPASEMVDLQARSRIAAQRFSTATLAPQWRELVLGQSGA
ncbi:MAG: glycosyl transferase, partial [Micrococcus sp.]|nr:glycosyl transferase [Micrococcus sp.]